METVFYFLIGLFADLLITINNIDFIFGYTLLQFLVASSFLVLLWQLVLYILSRTSGSIRSGARGMKKHKNYTKVDTKKKVVKP